MEKWEDFELPKEVVIQDRAYPFESDYRKIINIMTPLNDQNLTKDEKLIVAMHLFYTEFSFDYDTVLEFIVSEKNVDIETAISDAHILYESFIIFINGNKENGKSNNNKKVMDWKKDTSIIIAPINKALGKDIRQEEYMHWWTFLSYFMEIGECTWNTYVGIRYKKMKGKKLSDWEKEIYKNHKEDIDLKEEYDDTTLSEIEAILGRRLT